MSDIIKNNIDSIYKEITAIISKSKNKASEKNNKSTL